MFATHSAACGRPSRLGRNLRLSRAGSHVLNYGGHRIQGCAGHQIRCAHARTHRHARTHAREPKHRRTHACVHAQHAPERRHTQRIRVQHTAKQTRTMCACDTHTHTHTIKHAHTCTSNTHLKTDTLGECEDDTHTTCTCHTCTQTCVCRARTHAPTRRVHATHTQKNTHHPK